MSKNLLALMPKLSPEQIGWVADIVLGDGMGKEGDRDVVPFLAISRVIECITAHRDKWGLDFPWYDEFLELCEKLKAYQREEDNG